MAEDIILTREEIGELFYDLTVAMLWSSPLPDVRLSWPTGGAPAFRVSNNVIFLKAFDVPGSLTSQRESVYLQEGSPEASNMAVSYTRQLEVSWIFYGSSSWSDATSVRNKIFYQEHHDTLARKNIFLIPNFNPPRRVPELWQGQWYERMDLTMNFNELVVINEPVPSLETVEIGLFDKDGRIMTVDIIN